MGRGDRDEPNGMDWANFGLKAFISLAQLIGDLISGKKRRVEEDVEEEK